MRWIVLLRGINVGGHGKTPMAELRTHLSAAGAGDVATYIQSGNLLFDLDETDPDAVATWTSELIARHFGHRPPALAFTTGALHALLDANPWPEDADPKQQHLHLFRAPPQGDAIDRLTPQLATDERLQLAETCLYHWTPGGFGKSRVAQLIPKALGVPTTARNLRSIRAILDLA